MLLFKKCASLSSAELNEIKKFVGKTIESMLITREETLYIFKQYDTVLSCSLEGNYLVIDIYQLSKFALHDKQNLRKHNIPFFSAARSLDHKEETIVYWDDHKQKGFGIKKIQAFYHMCDLLETMEIDVFSAQQFKCVW